MNLILRNEKKFIGEASKVKIKNLQISKTKIGVANKDSSETTVNGCKIYETKFGIVNYIKKPYYSYPKLVF